MCYLVLRSALLRDYCSCSATMTPNCAPARRSALNPIFGSGSTGMNPFLMSQIMQFPVAGGGPTSVGQNNHFFQQM